MKTEFEVLNPSHQKYQKGRLEFEFEDNGVTLKKLLERNQEESLSFEI